MSSLKQNTKLCENKDLSVTGNSALRNKSRPPSVIQYHGLFYEHSSITCNDQLQWVTDTIPDFHDAPVTQRQSNKIYLDNWTGNERQCSGFFQPKATFFSKAGTFEAEDSSYSSSSRHTSDYFFRENATRLSSGGRALSRNSSRASSALNKRHYNSPEFEV